MYDFDLATKRVLKYNLKVDRLMYLGIKERKIDFLLKERGLLFEDFFIFILLKCMERVCVFEDI